MAKRVVPMSLHRYNWDLPQKLKARPSQPYFACSSPSSDCSQLQVIAFSGNMEKLLGSSASWHEFALLLRGLAALGVALDRAVAWPSLPCNTSWVSRLALAQSFIHLYFGCIFWICMVCHSSEACPWSLSRSSPSPYPPPLPFILATSHSGLGVNHKHCPASVSSHLLCALLPAPAILWAGCLSSLVPGSLYGLQMKYATQSHGLLVAYQAEHPNLVRSHIVSVLFMLPEGT